MGEKAWSTPLGTIHWRRAKFKVCTQFRQNRLIKTPVNLYKSCRWMLDLQLCLLHQGALQLEIFENNSVKGARPNCFAPWAPRARRPRRGFHWARMPRHFCDRRFPNSAPTSVPSKPSPRAARPRAEQTASRRPCRRPPTHVTVVPDRAHRRTPRPCRDFVTPVTCANRLSSHPPIKGAKARWPRALRHCPESRPSAMAVDAELLCPRLFS
jgi:hypothetical protein